MKLYLLRHGEAENLGKVKRDAERPLTEFGEKQVAAAAKKIKEKGIVFDAIFSSPYLRAFQTAEIVAKELDLTDDLYKEPPLASGCRLENIKEIITTHQQCKAILCVGHEPDFGIIAGELLNYGEARPLNKAELLEIEI
ncbi:MAG: phosphohistidine phosphatase SixA [Candidatus Saganbacteria bacterium]|nr:phosphohistidine phosphatase SixA [Candidatus Saganbacteria bacterium]